MYKPRCHPSILQQFNYTCMAQMSVLPPHLSGLCHQWHFSGLYCSLVVFLMAAPTSGVSEANAELSGSIVYLSIRVAFHSPEQFICIETCTSRALNIYKYADRILRQQLSKSIPLTLLVSFFFLVIFLCWTALYVCAFSTPNFLLETLMHLPTNKTFVKSLPFAVFFGSYVSGSLTRRCQTRIYL